MGIKVNPLQEHLQNVVDKTWNFSGKLKLPLDHEMNAIIGFAAEAAEVLDVGKKKWFHGTDTNANYKERLKDELGDACYYLSKVLDVLDLTLEEVLEANKMKLYARHADDIRIGG